MMRRAATMLLLLLAATLSSAQDWSGFRGPNGAGASGATGLPSEFGSGKNLLWKVPVPFARSSPVVAGDSIFLTAADGDKLIVLSLDRASGRVRWRREQRRKPKFSAAPSGRY